MLGILSVPGRPTNLQGATALVVDADEGCLDMFLSSIFFLSLCQGDGPT